MNKNSFWQLFVLALAVFACVARDQDGWEGTYKVSEKVEHRFGISARLQYSGPISQIMNNANHQIVKKLTFELRYDSEKELTFKIYEPDAEEFILPYKEPFPYNKISWEGKSESSGFDVVTSGLDEDFLLQIQRKDTKETIFDTKDLFLKYASYYREISTNCKEERIYGMGERRRNFLYSSGQYTLYNQDQLSMIETGQPGYQLYGNHPMWL